MPSNQAGTLLPRLTVSGRIKALAGRRWVWVGARLGVLGQWFGALPVIFVMARTSGGALSAALAIPEADDMTATETSDVGARRGGAGAVWLLH